MSQKRDLHVKMTASSKTTSIIDSFESCDEKGKKIYDNVYIHECFYVVLEGAVYSVSLKLERKGDEEDFENDLMTFSRLKKQLLGKTFSSFFEESPYILREIFSVKEMESQFLKLEKPVLLHAQSTADRTGFFYGKRFGQTNSYMITEVFLEKK